MSARSWKMTWIAAGFGETLVHTGEDVSAQSYPFPGRLRFWALIITVALSSVVNPGQMVELWDRIGKIAPIPIQGRKATGD